MTTGSILSMVPGVSVRNLSATYEGDFPWLQLAGDTRFRWVKVEVAVRGGVRRGWGGDVEGRPGGGLKFIFLSDVHLRRRWEPVLDLVIPRIRASGARMVLFGGDFVEDKVNHRPALPFVRRLLDEIQTELGTFAVTGNHDGPKLEGHLAGEKVRFITHKREVVQLGNGDELELVGLAGHRSRFTTPQILSGFPRKKAGVPRVVIGHYPFLIRKAAPALEPDLYLAGHTHGGQVCLPGGRILMSHDRLPKTCAAGVFTWQGTPMVVSRGLGFSHWQIRTWCPPEVHEVDLIPSVAEGA